ncbi:MAG TPA: DUF805 domain-containing protein [Microbacteriaceae bacterium]|nr:DUF805 domain-containing protein [Microbacteriaceae bacterium]HQX36421.1 DUF805 domain-containing protein [Microbacteriaceae bacterium]HQZ47010.1 DUF805 domain-containing protein [Microbacteriaceae bacterium]HRA09617.1 DUF805 domain-containing protein [Microbacteriaceae bacterium]
MTNPPNEPTPGWYPDPTATASGTLRWWNGSGWSTEVRAAKPLTPRAPAAPALTPPPSTKPPVAPPYAAPYGSATATSTPPAQTYGTPAAYPGSTPTGYPGASAAGYPGAAPAAYPAGAPTAYPGTAYPGTAPGTGSYGGYAGQPAQNLVGPGEPKTFRSALSSVFKQYVGFSGRASRSEYWYFFLFVGLIVVGFYVVIFILALLASAASTSSSGGGDLVGFGLIAGLLYTAVAIASLAVMLPSLAVAVRRLRDAGQHWAWLFISFVPFGFIALLVLLCQPSKPWALPRS